MDVGAVQEDPISIDEAAAILETVCSKRDQSIPGIQ
jgi:hypothetical protein